MSELCKPTTLVEMCQEYGHKPMMQEQSHAMMSELLGETVSMNTFYEAIPVEQRDNFALQVLYKRCKVWGLELSQAMFMIVLLEMETPAYSSMWVHTLKAIAVADGLEMITTDVLPKYFPMGLPTSEGYNAMWDAQKGMGNGDNGIDDPNLIDWDSYAF